ncbi:MAG: hypothetical protein Q7R58_01895 [bacterium]|nr:hypothetical protein [bacterium]
MNTDQPIIPARQAALNGLAVVGFIALVAAGIWLAVYSTRFVPTVVNSFGSAAVYLGSIFTPANETTLSVISNPVASTTISFGTASSSTPTTTTSTPKPATTVKPKPVATTPGTPTNSVYPLGDTSQTPVFSGLPDLIVSVTTGYVTVAGATSSLQYFVASSTVPKGFNPAVHIIVTNIGTNVAGPWHLRAVIPTQSSYIREFLESQPSINPGDNRGYLMSFDYLAANKGSGQMISVTVNYDHLISESNSNNNSASAQLTILGN